MLPKKGRREITVDGVLFHYKIGGCIWAIIRNSVTGEIITMVEDWKPKWKKGLKPSDIADIIRKHYENKG